MKTPTKHQGLNTSLTLGASALCVANSHAAIVFRDMSALDLTVSYETDVVSNAYHDFYYDSSIQSIILGTGKKSVRLQGKSWGTGDGSLSIGPTGKKVAIGKRAYPFGKKIGSDTDFTQVLDVILDGGLADDYFGIRITEGAADDGIYNYGWARVSTSGDGLSATLLGVAFESDFNTPILAGSINAVPEPDHLLSLSCLVVSAVLLRSRRRDAAAAGTR